jgi:hypothetical protein
MVAVVIAVLLALSMRLASRQASFVGLAGSLVSGQIAVHGALGLLGDGRHWPVEAFVGHNGSPQWLESLSGVNGTLAMVASHVLIALIAAVLLYGCESNLWAWFRIAALRLIRRILFFCVAPPPPKARVFRPAYRLQVLRLVSVCLTCGQRAPPTLAQG